MPGPPGPRQAPQRDSSASSSRGHPFTWVVFSELPSAFSASVAGSGGCSWKSQEVTCALSSLRVHAQGTQSYVHTHTEL